MPFCIGVGSMGWSAHVECEKHVMRGHKATMREKVREGDGCALSRIERVRKFLCHMEEVSTGDAILTPV